MKKILSITGLLALFLLMSFTAAEFYSTMTKVDYVEGNKTLKFTTKMNSRHVAEVLNINVNTTAFEAEVKRYVNSRVDVYVNGEPKVLTFTGSQVSGEAVWVYYEAQDVTSIRSLKIRNSIFVEAFPKQLNLVNVAYKGLQKNMTFQRGKEVNEVSF